eukprot:15362876-Alexandrium_andersonii.AAC.1
MDQPWASPPGHAGVTLLELLILFELCISSRVQLSARSLDFSRFAARDTVSQILLHFERAFKRIVRDC